jgi:chemotaxis protein MotB
MGQQPAESHAMSENDSHGGSQMIIIKRNKSAHDGHHGGAWKIAYADFMTAMMAFFLVMWLVNAANEETKASVASFFNPIQLADEKPTTRGLEKPVDQEDGMETNERSKVQAKDVTVGSAAASGEDSTSQTGQEANYSEADFFENPYSVLAEIAQEVGQQANVSAKGEGGASDSGPATGASGGDAYRDPFDPDFWTQQVKVTRTDRQPETDPPVTVQPEGQIATDPAEPANIVETAKTEDQTDTGVETSPSTQRTVSDANPSVVPTEEQAANAVPQPRPENFDEIISQDETAENIEEQRKADELKQEIQTAMNQIPGKLSEGLIVTPAEGGILVTVSDQSETPMFNVGSAVPRREMVLAMEKIGAILKSKNGSIIIRGHTDARPFKGGKNDNWRLSMERAHSAYFMLVHGGLTEERIKQVSGFADRRLQLQDDPLADQNRRIEILIEADEG